MTMFTRSGVKISSVYVMEEGSIQEAKQLNTRISRMQVLSLFTERDVISRNEILEAFGNCDRSTVYFRIQKIAADGLIVLQKTKPEGKSRRSRIVGAEITPQGKELLKELSADEIAKALKQASVNPCGQKYTKCYMASRCYLRYRCNAAQF